MVEGSVPESAAALTGAILLFLLPVDWRARRFTISWQEAVQIDWGTILLFGGGLTMGSLAFSTGLAEAMGEGVTGWVPVQSPLAFTILFTAFAVVLSEMTSNTASASMVIPVAIAVCRSAGIHPAATCSRRHPRSEPRASCCPFPRRRTPLRTVPARFPSPP